PAVRLRVRWRTVRPGPPGPATLSAWPPCRRAWTACARARLRGSSPDGAQVTALAGAGAAVAKVLRRRWRPGAGGRWRVLRLRHRPRTRATIQPSSVAVVRLPSGPARVVRARTWP